MRKLKKNKEYIVVKREGLYDIVEKDTGRVLISGYLVREVAEARAQMLTTKAKGGKP